MAIFPLPRSGVLSGLVAGLLALSLGQGARAQAGPDSDLAPQTIGGRAVVEIAGGNGHSCARVDNGWVYCWGRNHHGQLGDGTTTDRSLPVRVSDLTNATQISAGDFSACALRTTGRVFCWGQNLRGQLGDGTTTDRAEPVRVVGLTEVTQIALGRAHSCAVRSSGRVFCWGENFWGQIGDGTSVQRLTPVRVEGTDVTGATHVVTGSEYSCMLRRNGRVTCWGSNFHGQLGRGNTTHLPRPAPVPGLTNVTQLDAGGWHVCALRGSGRVFCWGNNQFGQIGTGSTVTQLSPGRVVNLTSVAAIGVAGMHSCAIRNTGRVHCWGQNTWGQLGDGTTTNRLAPVIVAGPLMVNATQLGAGRTHSCGLRPNGRAYCWGSNEFGQLGDGTTINSPIPVRVLD